MSNRTGGAALRQIRTLFHLGSAGALTDGQLLERFASGPAEAAEAAFAAIVERHGPLVLRACRAILGDEHDAQDAFQATFLVLVRKARSLWVRDSLGPWLLAVAVRAARCSRASRERRRARESRLDGLDLAGPPAGPRPGDLGEELLAALDRLPGRDRELVVLCDLQGLTQEEAARHLGCPVGTVKSRLSRARGRLRDRLARRGLAPIDRAGPRAVVPPGLARSTVSLAVQSAPGVPAGIAAAAAAPEAVALLVHGVSSAMNLAKLAPIAAPALALALAAGLVLEARGSGRAPEASPNAIGPPAAAPPAQADGGVLLFEVGRGTPAVSVAARGNVEASHVVEVRSPVDGRATIIEVVPEGTRVAAGDLVCKLDPTPLAAQLDDLRGDLALAEAGLAKATALARAAELARDEYQNAIAPGELKAAEAKIALAESEQTSAQDRLEWAEGMFGQAYIPKAELDEERLKAERARVTLDQARQERTTLEHYTQPKRVSQLQAEANQANLDLVEAKSRYITLKGQEERLREQVDACTIAAPIGGIVVYPPEDVTPIAAGAGVDGGQLLMTIVDLDAPMRVVMLAPEAQVHQLAPGQRARIRVDAFPDADFDGSVIEVAPRPDPGIASRQGVKVYPTLVELSGPTPGLRPGMTAESRVRVSEATDALRVPSRSVLRHDGRAFVAVRLPSGDFSWREVMLGLADRPAVEIESGLRPGDLVALDPIALLRRETADAPAGSG